MNHDIERLNAAARAYKTGEYLQSIRWLPPLVTPIFVLLALADISAEETHLAMSYAAVAAVSSLSLWIRGRYSLHVVAVALVCAAIGHVAVERRAGAAVMWSAWAVSLLISGNKYARVQGAEWEEERRRIDDWVTILKSGDHPGVRSIDGGSFWTGYWTYRILDAPDCSVVAKFKRNTSRLLDVQVFGCAGDALRWVR